MFEIINIFNYFGLIYVKYIYNKYNYEQEEI